MNWPEVVWAFFVIEWQDVYNVNEISDLNNSKTMRRYWLAVLTLQNGKVHQQTIQDNTMNLLSG